MDPADREVHDVDRFARIVGAREDEFHLDEAALFLSACMRPGVDIDAAYARLDDFAARVPAASLDGVRSLLFDGEGFRGDTEDYGDPRNSFLDAVIDRGRGIPITLSVLVIEVARRIGVRVLGIGMPGHFIVRAADEDDRWCDPFHGGAWLDRDGCAAVFHALHGHERPLHDADLAPSPPRAIVARILANLEHGRFGSDPAARALLSELHLAIPGVPFEQQLTLLRSLARGGSPARVEKAYERVAATAPDELGARLRAEAGRLRARWN